MDNLHEPTARTEAVPYGIRVSGNSMAPRIRHGQVLLVEPQRQCVPGEEVLILLLDGCKLVRELVEEQPASVTVMPVNGGERQTLDRSMVCYMHPVTGIVCVEGGGGPWIGLPKR